jgi:arsenite-transporting ATPase
MMMGRLSFFCGTCGRRVSVCAAGYAAAASRAGRKTLLISTGPVHALSDIFGVPFPLRRKELFPRLFGLEIDAGAEAKRYIDEVRDLSSKVVSPSILEEIRAQMELSACTPGIGAAAVFERVVSLSASACYEHLVFDLGPLECALDFFERPPGMCRWLESLMVRRKAVLSLFKMASKFDDTMRKELNEDAVYIALSERLARCRRFDESLRDPETRTLHVVSDAAPLEIAKLTRLAPRIRPLGVREALFLDVLGEGEKFRGGLKGLLAEERFLMLTKDMGNETENGDFVALSDHVWGRDE